MFNINGIEWQILAVPSHSSKLLRPDGTVTVASCEDDTKTIYVNNRLSGAFLKKVLCHEITHAAMFSYNIRLSLDQEELLADLIATYGDEIIITTNRVFKKLQSRSFAV